MVRFGKKVAVLTLAGAIAAMSVTNGWRGKDHAWSGKFLCKTAAGAV